MKIYKLVAMYQYDDAPDVTWIVFGKREAKSRAKLLLNSQIGDHKPFEVIVLDENKKLGKGRVACQLKLAANGDLIEHFAKW